MGHGRAPGDSAPRGDGRRRRSGPRSARARRRESASSRTRPSPIAPAARRSLEPRAPGRKPDRLHAGGRDRVAELLAALAVALAEQVGTVDEEAVVGQRHVSADLSHPAFVRVGLPAGDVDPSRGDLHQQEGAGGDEAALRPRLDRDETLPRPLDRGRADRGRFVASGRRTSLRRASGALRGSSRA